MFLQFFHFITLCTLLQIIGIIAFILVQLAMIHFHDVVSDSCQEISVMCYKHNCLGNTGKILLQPYNHILIQMVGRFIQQV